jgi:beta-mannosidase
MQTLSLNGEWELIERPLTHGVEAIEKVVEEETTRSVNVPGDVNDCLVRGGELPEPLVARNYEQFEWVGERSWWFRKRFEVPSDWNEKSAVELSLDGLDVHADVWCNGSFLGHHASSFRPFVADVKALLQFGAGNTVVVRLTTGREYVPDDGKAQELMKLVPTEADRGYPERGLPGRIYLRKPAYVWGWDWNPPLPTCGITGDAFLQAREKLEVSDVKLVSTLLDDGSARIIADVELAYCTVLSTAWGAVRLELSDEDGTIFAAEASDVPVQSGSTFVALELNIPAPRLWWPNGSGEQHRYTITVHATAGDFAAESVPFKYGLRTIQLEDKPGHFAFRVNNQPVFIKGGNWVPPDALYGRVTDERLHRLVREAAAANFNCLRVWGGGRFPRDAFFDACEENGILVWHDFMSACALLPAHEGWFHREFMAEAEYQVRRLRNRACMLLWCGNNEVSQVVESLGQKIEDPAAVLYFRDLPRLVHEQSAHIPYRPTSPYGGDNTVHRSDTGDCHHWVVMLPDSKVWSWPEYWDATDIPVFNSEYGYGGPCCMTSTREYMGNDNPDLFSETGKKHTNTFYDIQRVNHGINEHYRDPEGIALDDYILLGGLCQGLNLGYSLESLRANDQSRGGVHWMYNDSWGENGWSIIDYYLRRKIAFYNVARCLASTRLVLRRGGQGFGGNENEVVLIALNDRAEPLSATVELGYMSYDGEEQDLKTVDFTVAPFDKSIIGSVPVPDDARLSNGTVVAKPGSHESLMPVSWRHCAFSEAKIPKAEPKIVSNEVVGNDLRVTLTTESFAHAVHLDVSDDLHLSDHYFDMLAGEKRTITVYDGATLEPLTATATASG